MDIPQQETEMDINLLYFFFFLIRSADWDKRGLVVVSVISSCQNEYLIRLFKKLVNFLTKTNSVTFNNTIIHNRIRWSAAIYCSFYPHAQDKYVTHMDASRKSKTCYNTKTGYNLVCDSFEGFTY